MYLDKPPLLYKLVGMGRDEIEKDPESRTYPLRAAARLTGLRPELLRAWERRYGVVEPARSPGGTRRYSARLRRVKAAVDGGHRIGQVAHLDDAELERRAGSGSAPAPEPLQPILSALERFEGAEVQRLLALQLSALGAPRFARAVALPLVREIGERWANRELSVASEHLASGVLRSLLGSALQPTASALMGPRIVFATPSSERHELGLQMAALTAMSAGADPIYLGADLPVEELLEAAERSGAVAVGLSLVTLPSVHASRFVHALRGGLPDGIRVWIGGTGSRALELPEGVERIDSLEALEQRVGLLAFEKPGRS
jgi:methanogenic corrinoid protein MtbC1